MRLQLFSLFVLTVTLSARAQPLLPIETAAIYDLVSTFNILPTGWNVSDPSSVCSWPGIECSDRYIAGHLSVAILDFSQVANAASLVGSIPQSIKDLSQMRIMFLNPARFPSELPDQFPPQIHSLTAAGCGLQGTLPPWIINLGRIHLESNELRGPLPEFTGFTQLPAEMWFTNNRFAGSIPESWLTIPVASDPVFGMYINGNKLYGFVNSLPAPLDWSFSANCDFSSNFFCQVTNACIANGNKCLNNESDLIGYIIGGSYPATPIGSFSTFGTLVEGDTFINTKTFDCPKPPGIHRLTVTITLPFNVTSDTFDQLAGELSQWTVSAVQSGGVRTWTIAGDLACPVNSSKVVLSVYRGNPVISIIVNDEISAIYIVTSPSNTGNYAKWPNVSLQVSYTTANVDVAALLDFVSTCNTVPYGWDISHPATVCQWPNVECWEGRVAIVDLQTVTPLNCELTESLGDMTHLQYLTLEHVGLRGTIPASMSNMSALYFLSLNNNPELHGTIPESFGNLSNLNQLLMSYCNLSGTLPPSLGSLVNLGMLDLEGNNLRGPIPESFNNLINLYYVKLTSNKLAGWIPQPFINMMPQFNQFNVNNNKFYGCYGSTTFPTDLQEECNIQWNNFCCIPSHCADPGVTETQHCLGSPSSVMIWMSQGLYPPNIEFTAAGASNTYSLGYMVEGDTYRMTSSLSCNDPEVQARGVNVTITLQPLAVTFNNSIRTDTLTFGDPSRWTMVANTNGTYTVNGLVQCNSYLDTTNFTQLQQTYVVGVSVWQGSLVVGVLLQNDVAGAWASYATTPNGGIVTSNTENWSGSISIELSLA